jgi:hypothetical protein
VCAKITNTDISSLLFSDIAASKGRYGSKT